MKQVLQFTLAAGFLIALNSVSIAGNRPCPNHYKFTCTEKLIMQNGSTPSPITSSEFVEDKQPEPFDPPECNAAVILKSAAGVYVADYSDDHQTVRSWGTLRGAEEVYQPDVVVKLNTPLILQVRSQYRSILAVEISCLLTTK